GYIAAGHLFYALLVTPQCQTARELLERYAMTPERARAALSGILKAQEIHHKPTMGPVQALAQAQQVARRLHHGQTRDTHLLAALAEQVSNNERKSLAALFYGAQPRTCGDKGERHPGGSGRKSNCQRTREPLQLSSRRGESCVLRRTALRAAAWSPVALPWHSPGTPDWLRIGADLYCHKLLPGMVIVGSPGGYLGGRRERRGGTGPRVSASAVRAATGHRPVRPLHGRGDGGGAVCRTNDCRCMGHAGIRRKGPAEAGALPYALQQTTPDHRYGRFGAAHRGTCISG